MHDIRPVGIYADLTAFLREAMGRAGNGLPLFRRLADAVELAVVEGVLADGATLPSERNLQCALGVSRVTVRGALQLLTESGLLQRRQGARSVVRGRMEKTPALIGFSQEMRSRGMIPSTRWIKKEKGEATTSEAMALGLEAGALVTRLSRLRLADGAAIAVEDAVLPADFLRTPAKLGESLYDFLALQGFAPHHGYQRIRAVTASPGEADLLGLADNAPLLAIERHCFLADGRALEFARTRYSGATYEFLSQLTLPGKTPR